MTTVLAITVIIILFGGIAILVEACFEPSPEDLLQIEIEDALTEYLLCHDRAVGAFTVGNLHNAECLALARDNAWERYQLLCQSRIPNRRHM